MTTVHDARAAELDACTDEACLDAGEALWAPRVAALNAARDTLELVLDGLDAAHRHGTAPSAATLLEWARTAADAWALAAHVLELAGLEFPALPDEVHMLLVDGADGGRS